MTVERGAGTALLEYGSSDHFILNKPITSKEEVVDDCRGIKSEIACLCLSKFPLMMTYDLTIYAIIDATAFTDEAYKNACVGLNLMSTNLYGLNSKTKV